MNQSTGISCQTFCNRLYKCYYYKEKNSYLKTARLLFERILKQYDHTKDIFMSNFSHEISTRSYTGVRTVLANDRGDFRSFCTNCAININNIIKKFKISNINDTYCYKWLIKGYISGILHGNKDYNLWLSFENNTLTQQDFDFVGINNFLYNRCKGTLNDAIAMVVPTNSFWIIPYDIQDYTIKRGFLTTTKRNKLKKRGIHCLRCANNCNPSWINSLDRLGTLI
jgi:hypothetical protein